jgi:hypothetical protein
MKWRAMGLNASEFSNTRGTEIDNKNGPPAYSKEEVPRF